MANGLRLTSMQCAALSARLTSQNSVEAAAKLYLSPDAMRMRLHRARRKLGPEQRERIAGLNPRRPGRPRVVPALSLSFASV